MSLSRNEAGGRALTLLNLDSCPPTAVLNELHAHPDIESARVINL
jgi:D-3-phosphoglycerate dehydrogenase